MTYMESNFSITVNRPAEIPEVAAMLEAISKAEGGPCKTGYTITLKTHGVPIYGGLLYVRERMRGGAVSSGFLTDDARIDAIKRVLGGRQATMSPLTSEGHAWYSGAVVSRKQMAKRLRRAQVIKAAEGLGISVADYLALEALDKDAGDDD